MNACAYVWGQWKIGNVLKSIRACLWMIRQNFHDKTTAPNQLWQTGFTYLKVIGWGWFYLSTILDDYSRYVIAWKLCTTMKASDDRYPGTGPGRSRT